MKKFFLVVLILILLVSTVSAFEYYEEHFDDFNNPQFSANYVDKSFLSKGYLIFNSTLGTPEVTIPVKSSQGTVEVTTRFQINSIEDNGFFQLGFSGLLLKFYSNYTDFCPLTEVNNQLVLTCRPLKKLNPNTWAVLTLVTGNQNGFVRISLIDNTIGETIFSTEDISASGIQEISLYGQGGSYAVDYVDIKYRNSEPSQTFRKESSTDGVTLLAEPTATPTLQQQATPLPSPTNTDDSYSNSIWGWLILIVLGYLGVKYFQKKKVEKEKQTQDIISEQRRKDDLDAQKKHELFSGEQEARGLVAFIDEGKEYWGKPKDVEKWKKLAEHMKNRFSTMNHFEFEEFVGELFKKMGYNVTITKKTGDYGVDLVAKVDKDVIAVQVKRYAHGNNVGAEEVQELLGASWKYKANKAILVTTSDFTRQAAEQSKEAPIELWDKDYLYKLIRKYMLPTDEKQ